MRYVILFLVIFSAASGSAATLDSLVRKYVRPGYYYTENDTHRYKLTRYDLEHLHFQGLVPTHYYGASRLAPNRYFLHFERDDEQGRQAILVTCDTQFTNPEIKRIGLTGIYFNEYDNGRVLPVYRDSTRAYIIIDQILPYTGLSGLSISVHTNYKPYNMTIRTVRKDLWREAHHVQPDGSFRILPLLEHVIRYNQSPLRGYDTLHYVQEPGGMWEYSKLVLSELVQFLPDSLYRRPDIKAHYQWSFKMTDSMYVAKLSFNYPEHDPDALAVVDVLMTIDKQFSLVDRLVIPLVGRDATSYNNGRMPVEKLHINHGTMTVTRNSYPDASAKFTINSGSCGTGSDMIGHPTFLPDGWIEYWRITSEGRFSHDSTTLNNCYALSSRRYPQLDSFPKIFTR